MPGLVDIPGDQILNCDLAGQATAGTAAEQVVGRVPFNATVTAVTWVPSAAVTANGTNYFTLTLRNRGAAGAGATVPGTRSYAATNSVAFVAEAATLSATATDLQLAAGDVLTSEKLVTGTGLAMPAGKLVVTLRSR